MIGLQCTSVPFFLFAISDSIILVLQMSLHLFKEPLRTCSCNPVHLEADNSSIDSIIIESPDSYIVKWWHRIML